MVQQPQQQLNIELGEKEAEGIYANLAMLTHSPTEIIIDFARVMPRSPKARVLARIIMTPMHAKLLRKALPWLIAAHEAMPCYLFIGQTIRNSWFIAFTNRY